MRRKAATQSKSKLLRIITLPFRVLGMAGDVYVRGLTRCTRRRVSYGPPAAPEYLPKSFSAVSSMSRANTDDFRELLRAASAKSLGVDVDVAVRRSPKVLPKSCSVGMRRIDEDEPCEFEDDHGVKSKSTSRRSRSYSVRAIKS